MAEENVKNALEEYTRGQALMNEGRILQALTCFDKSIALSVDNLEAHLGKAICLTRLGQIREAELSIYHALTRKADYQGLCDLLQKVQENKTTLSGDRDIEWGWVKTKLWEFVKNQDLKGRALLDFGCGTGAELTRFAMKQDFHATAIDNLPLESPLTGGPESCFIQGDFLQQQWREQSFDVIVNCSAIEHAGLAGRYGVMNDEADADIEIMSRMKEMMKPEGKMVLTIPVGRDMVVDNLHRVYGENRIGQLLDEWDIEESCFWIKDEDNTWRPVDEESALHREPSIAYGIGCFILRLAPTRVKESVPEVHVSDAKGHVTAMPGKEWYPTDPAHCDRMIQHYAEKPSKVLIVRPDGIGDFVIFSGILPYFRKIFPKSHISLLVRDSVANLVEACPDVDEVIPIDREKVAVDLNTFDTVTEELRNREFDLALYPVYSRTELDDLLTLRSGAKDRITFFGDTTNITMEKKLYNDTFYTALLPSTDEILIETERNKDFIKGLGVSLEDECHQSVHVIGEDVDFIDSLLTDNAMEKPIVICPFAQYGIREWRIHKWAELISSFDGHPVVICGTDRESDVADEIIALSGHTNIVNLCGKTNLRQLAVLLSKSRLCVGLESGIVHVAAAVNCPNIIITGGGHFGRFVPYSSTSTVIHIPMECYGCDWRCRYAQPFCIHDIKVETVSKAMGELLENSTEKISGPRIVQQIRHDEADSTNKPDLLTLSGRESHKCENESPYLVSALISTYNSEKYIRACLEDLENQTISDLMEIIVVNSGSEENEEAIVKEFQETYDNIKYIKTEERESIYAAWNRALKIASGKYVTNANTDDRHRRDALEIMARALEENPDKAVVYADQVIAKELNGQRIIDGHRTNGTCSRYHLLSGKCPPGSQPMWRRALHNEFGYFDASFFVSGDYEFWLRISKKHNFLYLNKVLGERLDVESSVSRSNVTHLTAFENLILKKCYQYSSYVSMQIGSEGISDNHIFRHWPEVNIWKRKVRLKLSGSTCNIQDSVESITDKRQEESPDLSIVISTYDNETSLAENIEALRKQSENNFELIIVNNGKEISESLTSAAEWKLGSCYIKLKNNFGPSLARNVGAVCAKAEHIAFLDDDAIADSNFVKHIIDNFRNHDICGLRGRVLQKNKVYNNYSPVHYDLGADVIVSMCEASGASAFRRDVFLSEGGFEEDLFGYDGNELSYRIYNSQEERIESILYAPDVVVYHDDHKDVSHYIENELRQEIMRVGAFQKWPKLEEYCQYMRSLYPGNKDKVEKDYEWLLNNAEFLREKHPLEALEWAKMAVELEPINVDGCYTLGCILIDLNRHNEAKALFIRAKEWIDSYSEEFFSKMDKNAKHANVYISISTKLADCHMQKDEFEQAASLLSSLLNNTYFDVDEELMINITGWLEKFKKYHRGNGSAEICSAEDMNSRGEELFANGDLSGALQAFENAVQIEPRDSSAYNNIGVTKCQIGEVDKSLIYFSKAIEIDPHNRDAIVNYGQVMTMLKNIEDAKKLYIGYLERKPGDPQVSQLLEEVEAM